jgi:hypothetical protein
MDMQHAKILKNELENTLTKLVQDFEAQTGLVVTDVMQYSINQAGRKPTTRDIKVTAELP